MPRVTVLLPSYKGEEFVVSAVRSILGQTFTDLELICFDDGSPDRTPEMLRAVEAEDSRFRLICNEKNLGLPGSMNRGFEIARGEFIAIMHHDDLAVPDRIEAQVAFMDAHPEVGVCGGWLDAFGAETGLYRYPEHSDDIKAGLIFRPTFGHPAVMWRANLREKGVLTYDDIERTPFCVEDWGFWVRLRHVTEFANLQRPLIRYRRGEQSASTVMKNTGKELALRRIILHRLFDELGITASEREMELHLACSMLRVQDLGADDVAAMKTWLDKLVSANERTGAFPRAAFRTLLRERWEDLSNHLASGNWRGRVAHAQASGGWTTHHVKAWLRAATKGLPT